MPQNPFQRVVFAFLTVLVTVHAYVFYSLYVVNGSVLMEVTGAEQLELLMKNPGKVFSREDLMQRVWNYEYYGDMRTVDVTVRRLREKIEDDPGKPRYILTRRGVGYYFAG